MYVGISASAVQMHRTSEHPMRLSASAFYSGEQARLNPIPAVNSLLFEQQTSGPYILDPNLMGQKDVAVKEHGTL
jgi:hypothetical protein